MEACAARRLPTPFPMKNEEEACDRAADRSPQRLSPARLSALLLLGLFIMVSAYVVHHGKSFLMPLIVAVLVALVLQPVHNALRSLHFPRMLAAITTVAGLFTVLVVGSSLLVEPGSKWMQRIDRKVIEGRLEAVFRPVNEIERKIQSMSKEVTETDAGEVAESSATGEPENSKAGSRPAADASDASTPPEDPGKPTNTEPAEPIVVEIQDKPVVMMAGHLQRFGASLAVCLVLILFILAYGSRIARCFDDDRRTADILKCISADVSGYLFTITLINAGLGVAIGLAMWWLGLPNPALWGLLAMMLNYIPYLGAVIGAGVVFIIAAATFDSPALVVLVPIVYLILTSIEGGLITPMVLGERFRLNPLIVFAWISAWGAFWGAAGMLIAMPALVGFKIVCERTSKLGMLNRILSS